MLLVVSDYTWSLIFIMQLGNTWIFFPSFIQQAAPPSSFPGMESASTTATAAQKESCQETIQLFRLAYNHFGIFFLELGVIFQFSIAVN